MTGAKRATRRPGQEVKGRSPRSLSAGFGVLALLVAACGVPPVIDEGELVSIASDNPDAVCAGAALALDRLARYQAGLMGIEAEGFSATVFLVDNDEFERRCDTRDTLGCVREGGSYLWARDRVVVPQLIAQGLIHQRLGAQEHDFVRWGSAEAIGGAQSYSRRYSSDGDLPQKLSDLSDRPGLLPLAGNYFADLFREDPVAMVDFLRDAGGEDPAEVERRFEARYGQSLRSAAAAWIAEAIPGCSYGVPACSGLELPPPALVDWSALGVSCAAGQLYDVGEPLTWTVVETPDALSCSVSADTAIRVYGCGDCDQRDEAWTVDTVPGQFRSIDGLPGASRLAIEFRRQDAGTVTLSCFGIP